MTEHEHKYCKDFGVEDFGRYQLVGCSCGEYVTVASKLEPATKEEMLTAFPELQRIYDYEEANQ